MKKLSLVLVLLLSISNIYAQTKQDALVLYHNGRYRESVQVCEEELKENPNRVEPYDLRLVEILAEAKYYLGKNQSAMEHFQRYVANAPESGSRVGTAYYFMGEIFIKQARYQHADIALSSAVKKEPLLDSWWARLGYAREMAGNYIEAINAYDEALRLNSSSYDASRGRERVSAKLKR